MAETSVDGEDIEDCQSELAEEVDDDKEEGEGDLGALLNWHHFVEGPNYEEAYLFDKFENRLMLVMMFRLH